MSILSIFTSQKLRSKVPKIFYILIPFRRTTASKPQFDLMHFSLFSAHWLVWSDMTALWYLYSIFALA